MKAHNPCSEESFHDSWADAIDPHAVPVHAAFNACTAPENRWIMRSVGTLYGKRVLELGCGAGEGSVTFSLAGANVHATDLSGGMVSLTRRVAVCHGTAIEPLQCRCDALPYKNGSFDMVYAANVLHHADMTTTLSEVMRVLKPGGIFASWDPLIHNPIINIYRRMAQGVRTHDEHPLHLSDIRIIKQFFPQIQYTTTWFTTLFIFILFFLSGVNPEKERYWKKIITDHERLSLIYKPLELLDRLILRVFPFLRRYCWNIVIIATK